MNATLLFLSVLTVMFRYNPSDNPPRTNPKAMTKARRSFVIVLDPGHGGTEKGACRPATDICEKGFTLVLARRVKRVLDTLPNVRVVLTRSRDVHMSLYNRAAKAIDYKAALFISLHGNASPRRDQQGFEAFVYPPEELSEGFRECGTEANALDARSMGAWQVNTILKDMSRQSLRRCSVRLAQNVLKHLSWKLDRSLNRGLKQKPLAVLAPLNMPGFLLEVGFLDHPNEGFRMLKERYQHNVALAIKRSVKSWLGRRIQRTCSPAMLNTLRENGSKLRTPDQEEPQQSKPRRWKPRHLPNRIPWPDPVRRKRPMLVWST